MRSLYHTLGPGGIAVFGIVSMMVLGWCLEKFVLYWADSPGKKNRGN